MAFRISWRHLSYDVVTCCISTSKLHLHYPYSRHFIIIPGYHADQSQYRFGNDISLAPFRTCQSQTNCWANDVAVLI